MPSTSLRAAEPKLTSANITTVGAVAAENGTAPVRVGVIGAGDVSHKYLNNLVGRTELEIVACADGDPERALALSASYPGVRACTVAELLSADDIELVVNLTPPRAHAAVSMSVLEQGKHVYSEKPLATSLSDAHEVLAYADSRSLRVGVAPDTFLGAGTLEIQRLIAAGQIGVPLSVNAAVLNSGPERFHPNPDFLFREGAGPLFDIGPYYVTMLTAVLGPISRVSALANTGRAERGVLVGPRAGEKFAVETPTHVTAILQFASGCTGTLTTSFDVVRTLSPNVEIYGTEGVISAPQANSWSGPVLLTRSGDHGFTEMPLHATAEHGYLGLGLVEMAASIRAGRLHQADGARALHVLEVLAAISESAQNHGNSVAVVSSCEVAVAPERW